MPDEGQTKLQRLGLSAAEAQIYLALLRSGGTLGATALADAMGVQRTTVYPILTSLTQKGMVEAGAGYGSRFTAIHPDEALPRLITREREEILQRERLAQEELLQRKRLADELAKQLEAVAKTNENNGEAELIQVLRDPRVIIERFNRLQSEAERQIDVFTKPPFFMQKGNRAPPLRRGVRGRSLYEKAALEDPAVKPYFAGWISAGEEARVYDGELPHKLAIFDKAIVLMPLIMPAGHARTVLIRHPQLAQGLTMFFEFLWRDAKPISVRSQRLRTQITKRATGPVDNKNDANPHTSPLRQERQSYSGK